MGFTAMAVGAAVGHSIGQMAQWLAAPVQALVGFFAPWQADTPVRRPSGVRAVMPSGQPAPTLTCARARSTVQVSRLKVLRVAEPGRPRQCAGRMVISGRMDEVCAELDRLAQLEDARGDAGQAIHTVGTVTRHIARV